MDQGHGAAFGIGIDPSLAGTATEVGVNLLCPLFPPLNCFPPDTLVSTESGPRPIAQVEAGERVWAYDFRAGEWRLCLVDTRHDSEYDGPLVTFETEAGGVTATAYHPFWVIEGRELEQRPALRHIDVTEDRGGSLRGRWVNSHDLREGDAVFLRGVGATRIGRIRQRQERTSVCNLTVRELHTFAVGEIQALVHNVSGTGGAPKGTTGKLRDPKTGRYVPDPANPPSPNVMTDAQRRAAWKELAQDPNSPLTPAQRAEIQARGWRGPQRVNALGELETMELSHEPIPLRDCGTEVVPRWPADHAAIDPHRQLKK